MNLLKNLDGFFLDTNVFESAKFDFESGNMAQLLALCNKYDLDIYVDTVVLQEIQARVEKTIDQIAQRIKNEDLLYIRRVADLPFTTRASLKEKLRLYLFEQIEKNLQRFQHIDDEFDKNELLALYFNQEAPFGTSGKKMEFPDAIMMLSFKQFTQSTSKSIIVVSNDKGIEAFCTNHNIPQVNFVSAAVNVINMHFQPNNFFKRTKHKIKQDILDYILYGNIDFIFYGYTLDDTIYAEEYEIKEVDIDEIYLISEDRSTDCLEVSCEAEIEFEIVTEPYPDYEHAVHDTEDDVWYTFGKIQTKFILRKNFELNFEIEILDYKSGEINIVFSDVAPETSFDVFDLNCAKNHIQIIKNIYIDDKEL